MRMKFLILSASVRSRPVELRLSKTLCASSCSSSFTSTTFRRLTASKSWSPVMGISAMRFRKYR